MTNHPNHSKLSYPIMTPVMTGRESNADIIGQARTAAGAMKIYARYFAGTGAKAVRAIKACPERRCEGPVDGWLPELIDA